MTKKQWFELPPEEREKCGNCGDDITARYQVRNGEKFCSSGCAIEKTGLEFDPEALERIRVISTYRR